MTPPQPATVLVGGPARGHDAPWCVTGLTAGDGERGIGDSHGYGRRPTGAHCAGQRREQWSWSCDGAGAGRGRRERRGAGPRLELEQTAEQIRSHAVRASAVVVDLADADEVERAVAQVHAELGAIDVLVNAAGTDAPGPVAELDVAAWDRVLGVNLRATFLLAKAVWPDMLERGGGTIVNVSSVAGRRGWANAAAYCAAKFGLTGLTQALAAEGKPHRIRACVLYPGAMDTSWGLWTPQERNGSGQPTVPADALPPEQVARLIAWIAAAPLEVVLNEVTVTPLHEQGWP